MADPTPEELHKAVKRHLGLLAAVAKNPRYPVDAYAFVCQGVDYTCEKLGEHRDVSGRELLEGLVGLALDSFGYLAPTVLERWRVTSTRDFGEIVFTLVDVGLLGRSPRDSMADFENAFDLGATLRERYRIDPEGEEE